MSIEVDKAEKSGELVPLKGLNPVAIFSGDGLDPILREIEARATGFVSDASTAKGRKEIAAVAYKVAQSKTYLDGLGKDLVADWKAKAKAVDESRRRAREFLDGLKDRVRRPLTDWEEAEAKRERTRAATLAKAEAFSRLADDAGLMSLEHAEDRLRVLREFTVGDDGGPGAEEFLVRVGAALKRADDILSGYITVERMRRKAEAALEKERKEAAEKAAREAAATAERERAEREKRIAQEAAEKARAEEERRRIAAEEMAKIEKEAAVKAAIEAERKAERERQEREAEERRAAEERAADEEHRAAVIAEAVAAVEALGFARGTAEAIISEIAAGNVANVAVVF